MGVSIISERQMTIRFALTVREGSWFDAVPPVDPSEHLRTWISRALAIARGSASEKAFSEFLVAPILAAVWSNLIGRLSYFSGTDPDEPLMATCDFLFSRASEQFYLKPPIVLVGETTLGIPINGLDRCLNALAEAQTYNERAGLTGSSIYGTLTTGEVWQFLRFDGETLDLDSSTYRLDELPKILGILTWMLAPPGADGSPRIAANDPKGPR